VVDVSHRPDVQMRLIPFKLLLGHTKNLSLR
jgi:hypothetical protein